MWGSWSWGRAGRLSPAIGIWRARSSWGEAVGRERRTLSGAMARRRAGHVPPPPELKRRPEVSLLQIDELLGRVEDGLIRVPELREPEWGDTDRLRLLDSIYRGYPIGALVFWRRAAP